MSSPSASTLSGAPAAASQGKKARRQPVPRQPVPRYFPTRAPAFLSQGFRPFFLLAGLWAPLALWIFVAGLLGHAAPPLALDPLSWHVHELIFGYGGAVLAGFLLTAVPNWTGRLPLQGLPLAGLVGLWLLSRLATTFGGLAESAWPLALTPLFLLALLLAIGREILAGKAWRNLPVLAGVGVLLAAQLAFLAEAAALTYLGAASVRLGIAVLVALIALIGGRIVPSFTGNWLKARGEEKRPASFDGFDRAVLALTLATLAAWVVLPEHLATGALAALAAPAHLIRLARWRGWRSAPEPLLWVLHLGYLWLPVGFALLALEALAGLAPQQATVHAFTAGAIGSMTLAVMSRATLGHTGRALTAGAGLTACYLLVTGSALLRILAAYGVAYHPLVMAAALAWTLAFLCFLAVCGPMLLAPRPAKA